MAQGSDRRGQARFAAVLRGRLATAGGRGRDCAVLDISTTGAAVRCALPPVKGPVTLHLDEIGRVRATIVQSAAPDILRLAFTCDDAGRNAIAAALYQLLEKGQARPLPRRRQDRIAMTDFHLLRANGERIACEVLDISLQGISLRTAQRPPLGEQVTVAGRPGHVVRHHDQGIAIQLAAGAPGAPGGDRLPRPYRPPGPARNTLLDDRI